MAKKTKSSAPIRDSIPKPTLLIDSKNLRGNSFRVGKKATVKVTGKIVEESLTNYEAKGRKSYRMEIDKVNVGKGKRKGK